MIGTKALQVHIYPPMQRNGRVEYEAVLKSTSYLMYLVDMVRKPRRTCSYEYKGPRNKFQRVQMRLQVLTVVSGITSIYIYPSGAAKIARPEVMTAYSPTYRYALPESLQAARC